MSTKDRLAKDLLAERMVDGLQRTVRAQAKKLDAAQLRSRTLELNVQSLQRALRQQRYRARRAEGLAIILAVCLAISCTASALLHFGG